MKNDNYTPGSLLDARFFGVGKDGKLYNHPTDLRDVLKPIDTAFVGTQQECEEFIKNGDKPAPEPPNVPEHTSEEKVAIENANVVPDQPEPAADVSTKKSRTKK